MAYETIGLPELHLAFAAAAETAVKRSSRGVVAVVITDDTEGVADLATYMDAKQVPFEKMTKDNYNYLQLVFAGAPAKVIVLKASATMSDTLKRLKDLRFNYLVVPGVTESDQAALVAWIKEMREEQEKTRKLIIANTAADHEGIINLTTDNITSTIGGTTYTADEYCCRIAGIAAGLSLNQSMTYYLLEDVTSCDVPTDADTKIAAGELVIIYDGVNYKIARGVNSLQTVASGKKADMKKIKIVEGMDLYHDDILDVFETTYLGKVVNDLDHKQIFVGEVNSYHKNIIGDVLSKDFDNTAELDIDAIRKYLKLNDIDEENMTDEQVLKANTGSKMFLKSNVLFIDCMEDFDMTTVM